MSDVWLRHLLLLLILLSFACPTSENPDAGPSCEELECQEGAVCLDGACRPRACLEQDCPGDNICQPGPLCLPQSQSEEPFCSELLCDEGWACQEGAHCRPPNEDLDHDGFVSGVDCDDGDPTRFPGNPEVCDGRDNDCDGAVDHDVTCDEGQRCCGTAGCIDTSLNRLHCGACGQPCEIYESCESSRCISAPSPELTGIHPDPLPTGRWLGRDGIDPFLIDGRNLYGYATVWLVSEDGTAEAPPFEVVGDPLGRFYFNDQPLLIDGADLPAGSATLTVVRNDGLESNVLRILVQGAARPEVTRITPSSIQAGDETVISVYGTGFWGSPQVQISPDQPIFQWITLPLLWVTDTWLRTDSITLDPATTSAGYWILLVRNPDGSESEYFSLEVEAATPATLTRIEPQEVLFGTEAVLEISGFGLFGRPTLLMAPEPPAEEPIGDPLPALPLDLVDPRRLVTSPINFKSPLYQPGPYLVWVVNPDGTGSNYLRFVVLD